MNLRRRARRFLCYWDIIHNKPARRYCVHDVTYKWWAS